MVRPWHYMRFDVAPGKLYTEDEDLLLRMSKMPFAHQDDASKLAEFIMNRLNGIYARQEGYEPIRSKWTVEGDVI